MRTRASGWALLAMVVATGTLAVGFAFDAPWARWGFFLLWAGVTVVGLGAQLLRAHRDRRRPPTPTQQQERARLERDDAADAIDVQNRLFLGRQRRRLTFRDDPIVAEEVLSRIPDPLDVPLDAPLSRVAASAAGETAAAARPGASWAAASRDNRATGGTAGPNDADGRMTDADPDPDSGPGPAAGRRWPGAVAEPRSER
ncbi:hypothetical protein GCM10027515_04960 [Schumannella luteola]|uniref:Uncharacterized protein n=1 Tax=Schumannella luteola TaxID=472059 RepID=A0A852YF66_9MICO|nr:hypothetical protein [Schumannella luteola]NYG98367.1 hypothetical protein [Schumannella luteola]TPX05786.1 hypothetical protein FJ656_05015 [Schumannella luteola]